MAKKPPKGMMPMMDSELPVSKGKAAKKSPPPAKGFAGLFKRASGRKR
jgi:hypothetical protein